MLYLLISCSFVLPKTNNSNGAVVNNLFGTKTMKRLSLEELKAQKAEQVTQNLDAIIGGNAGNCHTTWEDVKQAGSDLLNIVLFFTPFHR